MKVTRRHTGIAILLLAVACVLAAAVFTSRGPEDRAYGGWRLSVWARHWGERQFGSGSMGTVVIREGTTALDSNAAPYLVRLLKGKDNTWRTWYLHNWEKLPPWLRKHMNRPVSAIAIRYNAISMLADTGPGSPETIAALLELVNSGAVANATASGGAEAARARDAAIRTLGKIGIDNFLVIESLSRLLDQSTNRTMQGLVIESLGQIGGQSQVAVDALVKAVRDGRHGWNRTAPIAALTRMGRASNLGVRGLMRVTLEGDDSVTGDPALRGLQELAPEQPEAIEGLVSLVRKPWKLRWNAMVFAARAQDSNANGLRAVIAVALDESEDLSSRIQACQVMELIHGRPPSFPGGGVWQTSELLAEMRKRATRELELLNARQNQPSSSLQRGFTPDDSHGK